MTPAPAEGLLQGASIPREILFLPHRIGSRDSLAQPRVGPTSCAGPSLTSCLLCFPHPPLG